MGKTKKKSRGKIIGRVLLVLGLIMSMTMGSAAAVVVHRGDAMLDLINYDDQDTLWICQDISWIRTPMW